MISFKSIQQQQKKNVQSPPAHSFASPNRPIVPTTISPVSGATMGDVQAHLERAQHFGHTLDRLSLFPAQGQRTHQIVQHKSSVHSMLQASMYSTTAEPVQNKDETYRDTVGINNTGLPDRLKAGIEHLSGIAMDDVQVHYNSSKPAGVQALAYTQGTDIHVGPGQEWHLAHEAWHVVQQKQGRVKPTLQAKGVAINDDQGLEREADIMGSKATTSQSIVRTRDRFLEISDEAQASSNDSGGNIFYPLIQAKKKVWRPKDGSIPSGYEQVNRMADQIDSEVDSSHRLVVSMLQMNAPKRLEGVSDKRYAYWLKTLQEGAKQAALSTGYIIEDAATHTFKGQPGFTMQSNDEMANTRPDVTLSDGRVTGYLDITSDKEASHIFDKSGGWGLQPYVVESLYPTINFGNLKDTPMKLNDEDMKLVEVWRMERASTAYANAQKSLLTWSDRIKLAQPPLIDQLNRVDINLRQQMAAGTKRWPTNKDTYDQWGVGLDEITGNITVKTPEQILKEKNYIFLWEDIAAQYGLT